MAGSDSIVVVGDWISEHYFTTESTKGSFQSKVLQRRKAWAEAEETVTTPLRRFTQQRAALEAVFASLDPESPEAPIDDARALYASLRELLGFSPLEYQVGNPAPGVFTYQTPSVTAAAPLVIVDAVPVATHEALFEKAAETLLDPYPLDETTVIGSAVKLVSHLFLQDEPPRFSLILAGRWAVLGEQTRWAEGRYLAIDLQAVAERNDTKRGGEVERALTCLSAESLAPDADGDIWWTGVLEDSVQHTAGVSKDLREGVRLSIEIIANEVVARRRDKGLNPLPQSEAQTLAQQSLRYLYRILFLLYAEASPELAVLPVQAPEYESGYSLTRLRELTLTELPSHHSQQGTHLYQSLDVLFRLIDRGHTPKTGDDASGLQFQALRADLFRPEAISLVGEVGLGNAALQQVLKHLLLTRETGGKDRGFISYAELGINQLGAVYEGLMSYTGFFAEEDLYEVARDGNPEKGSWVVPFDRVDGLDEKDLVRVEDPVTGEPLPRIHRTGQFVFRLSGRARQQSASYYTPEVLTKFTVSQALAELLDQDGTTTTADEILELSVCEPALGSGAFAIEAVRQLAAEYLTRKQDELGRRIDPEDYPAELQKVKAHIALHQVHGVDLNALAVEFAEITLWLDTMATGLDAPWFGLHLRRGNSLIGARRSVYTRDQVNSRVWLNTPALDVPLTDIARRVAEDSVAGTDAGGRIPHWLLPASGWGATADSKEAAKLAHERTKSVKDWRKSITKKPTKSQLDALVEIGYQAEELWTMAYRRLLVAEQESRRSIDLWGRETGPTGVSVSREQIETSLADENGAYRRLRRVMDAWCALWFWPLTGDEVVPPSLADWIDACQQILGKDAKARKRAEAGLATLSPGDQWQALADQEDLAIIGAGGRPISQVKADHPWLEVCERVATEQGFFHWQLDFAPAFGRGGFDLQVGNPPWVRPRTDVDSLLAEGDPWWQLANKPSEAQRAARREATLALAGIPAVVITGDTDVAATGAFVGAPTNYPHLVGLQPDLYRCFMEQVWAHSSDHGTTALIHPESHFTDEKAKTLRAATYPRLRRHWQFINELKLFSEIHDLVSYGVHVYASDSSIRFLNASALYHPDTIERSFDHDGSGAEPGFKHDGYWDLRPHQSRIQSVDDGVLSVWHEVLEDDSVPTTQTRMLYTVNQAAADALRRLSVAERVGSLGLQFSRGWDESIDRKKGYFVQEWGAPESWADVILQGPHLHVNNPAYKIPNPTMKHNQDWSPVDLEQLPADAIPVTSYKTAGDPARYAKDYGTWDGVPVRDHYRIAWRAMAANSGERTLIPALIPPGTSHPNGIFSVGGVDDAILIRTLAGLSSLLCDFSVRAAPKSGIYQNVLSRLPSVPESHPGTGMAALRTLRLNCMTSAHAQIWESCWRDSFARDRWVIAPDRSTPVHLEVSSREWTALTPLRNDLDRRNAQVEIDALVAIMLGVTADELCTIYRTQFAVLHGYDQKTYYFDANGRRVPQPVLVEWRKRGDSISLQDRTHTNESGNTYVYELPFRTYDREADMRTAYAEFERRLGTSS